jgi:hypothetical protein
VLSLLLDFAFAWLLERRFASWLMLAPLAVLAGLCSSAAGGMAVAAGLPIPDLRWLPVDPTTATLLAATAHPAIVWWLASRLRQRRSAAAPGRDDAGAA